MTPLPGVSHDSKYACKLKKVLYDLKQAPHAWFEKFYVVISSLGFVSNSHDLTLLLSTLMQVISFYLYVLRTRLLLVMTLMVFHF
jgi:hypothetical protein